MKTVLIEEMQKIFHAITTNAQLLLKPWTEKKTTWLVKSVNEKNSFLYDEKYPSESRNILKNYWKCVNEISSHQNYQMKKITELKLENGTVKCNPKANEFNKLFFDSVEETSSKHRAKAECPTKWYNLPSQFNISPWN